MATSEFINRNDELAALEELCRRDRAELFVLYGRRRVGKTELIRAFCRDKPHVYFQAAQVADSDNLRPFVRAAAEATGDALLARASFDDWEAPFEYLAERARQDRLIVVLDEFPYLCEDNASLPSVLQRFWDQHGKGSRMFLILCGSSVSFMENEVLAQRSPLFGRRTGQQELLPLHYRQAAEFLPRYSLPNHLRAYGILGGMPMYLAQFDGGVGIRANVLQHMLRPQALLYDEPTNLLRIELRDPSSYNSILDAIASGLTRHNEITQRVGVEATALSPYLETLRDLRIISRVVSVTDRAPKKRARGRYFIQDNFLRFWYRFVLPNRSLLEMGEAERVWTEHVEPHLDEYLGLAFEDVCREYVRRYAREKLPVLPAGDVGRYWHKGAEIDVLCRNSDGSHYCGECKWTRRRVGESVLDELREKAKTLPEEWQEELRYMLFAREGFTKELQTQADGERLILVNLAELYGHGAMES